MHLNWTLPSGLLAADDAQHPIETAEPKEDQLGRRALHHEEHAEDRGDQDQIHLPRLRDHQKAAFRLATP